MTSLQELCLNSIEGVGADTREVLKEIKEQLPQKMWSRHPTLIILCKHSFDHITLRIKTKITVEYTGVYTLKVTRQSDDEMNIIKHMFPEFVTEYQKTFDSLYGELITLDSLYGAEGIINTFRKYGRLEDHIKFSQDSARPRLVANEIMKLLRDGDYVDIWLENAQGERILELGEHESPYHFAICGRGELPSPRIPRILNSTLEYLHQTLLI